MEDILALLPPEWVATWAEWAPLILAALTATTVAVPALLPAARKLETWTKSTPARWDDTAASWLLAALDTIASGAAWLLAHLPRVTATPARKESLQDGQETTDA